MGLIFNDRVITGESRGSRVSSAGIVVTLMSFSIAACFAAPYLPYPKKYCATHPANTNCVQHRPGGQK